MYLAQVRPPEGGEVVDGVLTIQSVEYLFNNIVAVALSIAGIVLFILLIMGGFKFITAGGEPAKVEGARKTLTSAIIGLVVIVLSFLILRIIQTITGVDTTVFRITIP
ncbi:hypothetical protein A2W13_01180 [Candidatus Woesebacteria bacterium RBG_16_36_11]|uniref:Uncharacterized protein n=3 Tax=Candidatus Woeseibacteriota TaxID=1752722 RepID=A0A1F7XBU8_9BACT|nr:MAG: hypothetical protein A2Z67_03185 [Candidatus Woesebacteria bacterium RBG_13_36_22]OGM12239.1 MAG: hypothetical protein A2W13_01180 [Candidatus Woesebacteria bacterium RBG_16_36_11]OGM16162.1 MAG: hypothetical protein A2V55_01340 [Candidatus Woesebacteria bacterium RBG_19FT_COMBO_37_29]